MSRYLTPTRIVLSSGTTKEEYLLEDRPMQTDFNVDDCAVIGKDGFVVLDFGKEIVGGITISIQKTGDFQIGTKLRIVFGESVMESLSSIGYKNATNDHSVRDTQVEICSMSTMKYGATGFRFVKLQPVDADIYIKSVKAELDIKEIKYAGDFECNDELLNKIWKTGAYTVHLNMHKFIWDGIKRDRLVWIGDMHPETSSVRAVFGNDECIRNSLDFTKKGTPPDQWMNTLDTYSMWWIIIHYDYYMQNGDIAYLKAQIEYLKALCEHAFSYIDNGMKCERGRFVDWSSKDTESETEGAKSVFCIAMGRAAEMFALAGETENARKCGLYRDKLQSDKSRLAVNKNIAALDILANRGTDAERKLLTGSSAKDMSCFLGYYVLCAKAKMGQVDEALDIIRKYWGGMLQMGATTFWEDFDIDWLENSAPIDEVVPTGKKDIHGDFGKHCYKQFRHSLCHGWASGPTAFLSDHVLGIKILEPGCRKIKIQPELGGLKRVRGKYPTPYGVITVEHKAAGGKVLTEVHAPQETEIVY